MSHTFRPYGPNPKWCQMCGELQDDRIHDEEIMLETSQDLKVVRSRNRGKAYNKAEADALFAALETEIRDLKSLHADIIEQGRKVQIAASGESKYGAMSDSEFIEWTLGKLEDKC